MFNCYSCKHPVGPKVSPIVRVLETREKDYYGEDPEDQDLPKDERRTVVVGHGTEIVKEGKLCPTCAGFDPPTQPDPKDLKSHLELLASLAQPKFEHLQGSGKKPGCSGLIKIKDLEGKVVEERPCLVCQRNRQWFDSLTLIELSYVLSEVYKRGSRVGFSLASIAIDAIIARSVHGSVRAGDDCVVGMRLFRDYEERGGSL